MPESVRLEGDGRETVVFIHGQWLHAHSWLPWMELFERNGYDCVAPDWPGESASVAACRAAPADAAGAGLEDIREHVAAVIEALPSRPILIGHGMGALIARSLLGSSAASAAIAVAPWPCGKEGIRPVPALGVVPSRLSVLRHPWRTTMLTATAFRRWFANAVDDEESVELYRRFVIPAGTRPLWDAIKAPQRRHPARSRAATGRGPLLLVSGSKDVLVPERSTSALQRRYRRTAPEQVSDHQVFLDRGHSMLIDARWLDVAYFCLDWLTRQNL